MDQRHLRQAVRRDRHGSLCWRLIVTGRTAARLGESTLLLNIPFEPIYFALGVGIGLYSLVLFTEAFVLARTGEVPLLSDESRIAMGQSAEDSRARENRQ